MKKSVKLIGAYIVLLIVVGIILYTIPSISTALATTEVVEYDTFKQGDEVTCYIARNENVYLAANSGSLNYYAGENEKVRAGVQILEINANGTSDSDSKGSYDDIITKLSSKAIAKQGYRSEFQGVVSYSVDGLENTFVPENLIGLSWKDIEDIKIGDIEKLKRKNAVKGEPIYKICRNDEWYITCWLDIVNISKYEVGKTVTIQFPKGDVVATISNIEEEPNNKSQVIFKCDRYYEEFATIRKLDATIVTSEYSGIIIPNKSITTEDGQPGVYVKDKNGVCEFVPIKIKTSNGDISVVKEDLYYDEQGQQVNTVQVYDEILKSPKKTK